MNKCPNITVKFFDSDLSLSALTSIPRKIVIKNAIGSGLHRCWVELYNEDNFIPLKLGYFLEVWIEDCRCFYGRITEKRIDSIDDQLSLYAEWDPECELYGIITHRYENQSVTDILNDLLSYNGMERIGEETSNTILESLHFVEYPIFSAVDLLAKLAGNWYWDIQEFGKIRFRPPSTNPDHWLHLIEDHYDVNLWQTTNSLVSLVEIRNSAAEDESATQRLVYPDWTNQSIGNSVHVYAHPIISQNVLQKLIVAINQQMNSPHYEHYIDLFGRGEKIQPGDRIQFSIDDFSLFPYQETFRVKQREIEFAHNKMKVRLHLTTGYESSTNYFDHLKHNRTLEPNARLYRFGPFQLDVSQLDSPAHLDPL